MPIKAGFAKVNITPPLGCEMPGGFFKQHAASVHDPLYARAAWLDDGETVVAIASVDCVFVEAPTVARAREKVGQWQQRDVTVLMAATHTHSGGPTGDVLMSESDPAYLNWVADQTATAIVLAGQRAREAAISTAVGSAPGVGFNRRFRMKDGSTKTNPGYQNPDMVECLGPVDPDVPAIVAFTPDGGMLGCIVGFACHSTFMSGRAYSGDYASQIELLLNVPTVFLPGAIGDINQCDFVDGAREDDTGEAAAYRAAGDLVAGVLLPIYEEPPQSELRLDAMACTIELPLRGPSAEGLSEARAEWDAPGEMSQEKVYARELILLDEIVRQSDVAPCELMALTIGDMRIAAASVQPFCQIGLDVKAGMDKAMFVGLANGHLGYVGPAHAYDEGGYELELKRTSRLAPGSGEMIVEALRGMLNKD